VLAHELLDIEVFAAAIGVESGRLLPPALLLQSRIQHLKLLLVEDLLRALEDWFAGVAVYYLLGFFVGHAEVGVVRQLLN